MDKSLNEVLTNILKQPTPYKERVPATNLSQRGYADSKAGVPKYTTVVYLHDSEDGHLTHVPTEQAGTYFYTQTTTDCNKAGTAALYNLATQQVEPITDNNTTESYRNKISAFAIEYNKSYQDVLKQQNMVADYYNPTDVNSPVDVQAHNNYILKNLIQIGVSEIATSGSFSKEDLPDFIKPDEGFTKKTGEEHLIDHYNMMLAPGQKQIDAFDEGNWGAILVNTLTGFSETMDYCTGAAYVKYLFLGEKGDTNPYIFDPEKGRKNYDYDTGNKFLDFGLEVISDPTTWLSFGASGLAKGSAKTTAGSVAKKVTKELASEYGDEVAEAVAKNVQKSLSKALINPNAWGDTTSEIIQKITKTIVEDPKIQQSLDAPLIKRMLQAEGVSSLDDVTENTLKQLGLALDETLNLNRVKLFDSTYNIVHNILKDDAIVKQMHRLDFLRGLNKAVNQVQSEMFNAAMLNSPLMPIPITHYLKHAGVIEKSIGDVAISFFDTIVGAGSKTIGTGAKYVFNKIGRKIKTAGSTPQTHAQLMDAVQLIRHGASDDATDETLRNLYSVITKQKNLEDLLSCEEIIATYLKGASKNSVEVLNNLDTLAKSIDATAYDSIDDLLEDILKASDTNSIIYTKAKNIKKFIASLQYQNLKNAYAVVEDIITAFDGSTQSINTLQQGLTNMLATPQTVNNTLLRNHIETFLKADPIKEDLKPILEDITKEMHTSLSAVRTKLVTDNYAPILNMELGVDDGVEFYARHRTRAEGYNEAVASALGMSGKVVKEIEDTLTDIAQHYKLKLSNQKMLADFMEDSDLAALNAYTASGSTLGAYLQCVDTIDTRNILHTIESYNVYKSVYDTINNIPEDILPTRLKVGLFDVLSNHTSTSRIYDVATFTSDLLHKAKNYVDSVAHVKDYRFHKNFNTPDTTLNIKNMLTELQDDTSEFTQAYKETVTQDKINVLFSVARTPTGIDEIAFYIPEGKLKGLHTFRHRVADNFMTEEFAQNTYGISLAEYTKLRNARKGVDTTTYVDATTKVRTYINKEKFDAELIKFLREIQTQGLEQGARKGVLLLGHNSASEYLQHSKALSDILSTNYSKVYLKETVLNSVPDSYSVFTKDISQIMNGKHGGILISDETYAAVEAVIKHAKQLLDNTELLTAKRVAEKLKHTLVQNKHFNKAGVYLVPNFTDNGFIQSVHNVLKQLNTDDMDEVTAEIVDTLQKFELVVSALKKKHLTQNSVLNNVVLPDALTNTNIMALINNTPNVPLGTLSLTKMYDKKIFNNLKTTGTVGYVKDLTNPAYVLGVYNANKTLSQAYREVVHPDILVDIYNNSSHDALYTHMDTMLDKLMQRAESLFEKDKALKEIVDELAYVRCIIPENKIQQIIQRAHLVDDALNVIKSNPNLNSYLSYFKEVKKEIFLKTGYTSAFRSANLRNSNLAFLDSHYFKKDSKMMLDIARVSEMDAAVQKFNSVRERIAYKRMLLDVTGLNSSESHIQMEMLRTMETLIDGTEAWYQRALNTYLTKVTSTGNAKDAHMARRYFTRDVKRIQDMFDNTCASQIKDKLKAFSNFTTEDYAKYLYTYAKGKQIVYLKSKALSGEAGKNFLINLSKIFKEGAEYGIDYKIINDDKLLIWLKKSITDNVEFIENAKTLELPKLKPSVSYAAPINNFLNIMDDSTANAYSFSAHTAFEEFHFNELHNYYKAHGITDVISEAHFADRNAFLNAFNHSIIGDYGDGVGEIFSKTSRNPISNFASGFNSTYRFMATKENYATLLFNKQHTIRKVLGVSTYINNTELKQALKTIQDNNLVACRLVNGSVRRVALPNTKALRKCLNDAQVMLLNYRTYTSAVEHLNNNVFSSPLYKFLNRHWFAPLKIGQLSTLGWVLRNVIDSVSKSLVQSRLSVDSLKLFNTTQKIMHLYDSTLATLYKETRGLLTKNNLALFFMRHRDDVATLDEATFRKLHSFYASSSASPTAKQLDLQTDIMSLIKSMTKDIDTITDADLKYFVKFYENNPGISDLDFVRHFRSKYADDKEKGMLLGRLVYSVPKKTKELWLTKMPTTKMIMGVNNHVEAFVRTHTFLFQEVYTNNLSDAAYRMVDLSQFNTTRNSKFRKLFDQAFPFSSFAIDNLFFYIDELGNNPTLQRLLYDGLPELYLDDDQDLDKLLENQSWVYMIANGNIPLMDSDLYLKTNFSLFSALKFLTDPVGTFSGMTHTSIDSAKVLLEFVQQCIINEETPMEYIEATKELQKLLTSGEYVDKKVIEEYYSKILPTDALQSLLNLIPLVGVTWQRWTSAMSKTSVGDSTLQYLFPGLYSKAQSELKRTGFVEDPLTTALVGNPYLGSIFGVVKPSKEKSTYFPSIIYKDPARYIDNIGYLQELGYDKETAYEMLQQGWRYDEDASTFYNNIASYNYYIIQNGFYRGINAKEINYYEASGFKVYQNKNKIPYWLSQDSEVYATTYKYYENLGYTPPQIISKMAEGWYVAVTGDLINRKDLNIRDQKAYEQLQLWQEGKAPFPADYVKKDNRINSMGDGITFAEEWYAKNGFEYLENMWLDPETGKIYFKGENAKQRTRLYSFAKPRYVKKVYPKKVYHKATYHTPFNINKYSPIKYTHGVVRPPKVKNIKAYEVWSTRKALMATGHLNTLRVVRQARRARSPLYNPNIAKIRSHKYRRDRRQYLSAQIRYQMRY